MTLTDTTVNSRFKEAIKALKATYDEIAEKTGVSRSTIIRMMEDGTDVKIGNIEAISSIYDIPKDYILTGIDELKSVTPVSQIESIPTLGHQEESVQPNVGISNQVNEVSEKYREFKKDAPRGSYAAKLKEEDYDNPMVVLDYCVRDLKRDWDGEVRTWPAKKRMEFLKEALQIINNISAKHLKKLE